MLLFKALESFHSSGQIRDWQKSGVILQMFPSEFSFDSFFNSTLLQQYDLDKVLCYLYFHFPISQNGINIYLVHPILLSLALGMLRGVASGPRGDTTI
jgi:hypothetical protein